MAGAIAAVWAVHPLNVGAVTYISARSEVLMAVCYLTAMLAAAAAHRHRPRLWMSLAVLSCAAGMACKESMVTAPIAIVLFDRAYVYSGLAESFRRRGAFYAALAATWGVLVALLWNAPHSQSAGFDAGVNAYTYLLNQALIIPDYLRLALWPSTQVLTYGEVRTLTLSDVGAVAVVVPALLAVAAWLWMRRPALGFPLLWFFVTLAPTSSVVPIVTEAGASRRMYLPLIGLVALAVIAGGFAIDRSRRRMRIPAWTTVAVASAVVVALTAATAAQNRTYMSPESLWRQSLAHWPSAVAHRNLATVLKAAGRRDEVVDHLRAAAGTFPEERYTLGVELLEQGMPAAAVPELERAIAEHPNSRTIAIDGRYALARAYRQLGRHADAAAVFDAILQRSPDVRARVGKANALLDAGDFAAAHREYQQVLTATPDALDVLTNDGVALLQMGLPGDALPLLRRVAAQQPQNAAAQVNLAAALAGVGDLAGAAEIACRALAADPGDARARSLAADIRAVAGQRQVRVSRC
jgi:tetratricopeptide (TPR) repeat protein